MTKINFGYKISSDRQLDYEKADLRLDHHLRQYESSICWCISCGTCAATCSAGRYTDFSLRELIIRIRRGNIKGIRTEAEKCMLCGKCQLICPRLVNTRNLILEIQRGCEILSI